MNETVKRIFHYTIGTKFEGIAAAGEIAPASAGVMPPEIPAVWLSVAAEWENTATKGVLDENGQQRNATLAEMVEDGGCLVRIEIDPSQVKLIYPVKMRESLRMPKQVHAALVKAARSVGADPMEWRAVAGPIPLSAFLRVEVAKETSPIRWIDADSLLGDG